LSTRRCRSKARNGLRSELVFHAMGVEARLLVASDGRIALDLDPGVAWLTTSAVSSPSRFFVVGSGEVEVRPMPG